MIAIDASSFRRYLDDIDAPDTQAVSHAVLSGEAAFPPVALAELLSDPNLRSDALAEVQSITVLRIASGFWHRAGFMRAELIRAEMKPKLPDTLIAQSCIDHRIPLITYDDGFEKFVPAGLKLL